MANYDFIALSPHDFETMTHDLMQRHLKLPLQAFATGRDKGVDIRYCKTSENDCVIQCKHYAGSGYAKLKSHIKNSELAKIGTLQPKRYILVTSVGLSPGNVDDLFALLSPYCRSKQDIVGRDNINALLRHYSEVETSHFKLWLSSEAVLSKLLNNDVFVRSRISQDEIKRRIALYVPTRALDDGRQQLNRDHVVVIAGVPGVGKTTLAEMLITEYIDRDWEVVAVEQNISEALRSYKNDAKVKQVLYYDDFLGQISVGEKLAKNEDRSLIELIKTISTSSNKRLILTTREYILAQAKSVYEQLSRSQIDLLKFVVKCEDYSEMEKAKILANHLFFYDVPQDHIGALVENKRYREIVNHRNYNPRIVEWMTNAQEVNDCPPKDYPKLFIDRLNNPTQLWTHAFEHQLSEAARHVLLSLVSCGSSVYLSDLKKAFSAFFGMRSHEYGIPRKTYEFESALNELEGSFILIRKTIDNHVILPHNPSISDFLVRRLQVDQQDVADLLRAAVFFEQVERLLNTFDGTGGALNVLSGEDTKNILNRTYESDSIGIVANEDRTSWYRVPTNNWQRLRTLCLIAERVSNNALIETTEKRIVEQLEKLQKGHVVLFQGFEFVSRILSELDKITWVTSGFVEQCNTMVKNILVARETLEGETIDGLDAIVEWELTHGNLVNAPESTRIREHIVPAISLAINEMLENDSSSRSFEEASATCSHLQEQLSVDLSQHIQTLDSALERAQRREREEYDEPDDDWRQFHDRDAGSIDSLFDALIN